MENEEIQTDKKNIYAILAVISAGILWGLISLFVKPLYEAGLSTYQVTFLRMSVAAPLFAVITFIRSRDSFRVKVRHLWALACMGVISIVIMNYCYFYTMTVSGASVAVVLMYTSPIFVILLSALIFKEKITKNVIVALVMVFAGCIFVSGLIGSDMAISALSFAAGLASGLFYGSLSIFGRFAVSNYNSMTVTLYTLIFGCIGSAFLGRPTETWSVAASDVNLIALALALGAVSTVLPYLLYTYGLKRMASSRAAIIVTVEPMVGCVVGILVFGESAGPVKIAGIVLILAAIPVLEKRGAGRPKTIKKK